MIVMIWSPFLRDELRIFPSNQIRHTSRPQKRNSKYLFVMRISANLICAFVWKIEIFCQPLIIIICMLEMWGKAANDEIIAHRTSIYIYKYKYSSIYHRSISQSESKSSKFAWIFIGSLQWSLAAIHRLSRERCMRFDRPAAWSLRFATMCM